MNLRPQPTPDFNWYSGVSADRGLPTHCPFAIASLCPRHYQSLSLLKSTGATEIEPQIDESLLKKWKRSPLWPLIAEQATSVSGSDVKPASSLNNFCPEVAYVRYKVFASCIVKFNDELQSYLAHEMLERLDVPVSDWRWTWQHLQPMHYSECPLYSVLLQNSDVSSVISETEELIEIKPGILGISANLKVLIDRVCIKWLRWRKIIT